MTGFGFGGRSAFGHALFAEDDENAASGDDGGTDKGQKIGRFAPEKPAKSGGPDECGVIKRGDGWGVGHAEGLGDQGHAAGADKGDGDEKSDILCPDRGPEIPDGTGTKQCAGEAEVKQKRPHAFAGIEQART